MKKFYRRTEVARKLVFSALLVIGVVSVTAPPASAQCVSIGIDQTCTNSTYLTFGDFGILDLGTTLTVTNTASGTIIGTTGGNPTGLAANFANITNYGLIAGTGANSVGIVVTAGATISNFGIISGVFAAIYSPFSPIVLNNSGAVMGGTDAAQNGIIAGGNSRIVNSGVISGFRALTFNGANNVVTNSGVIIGNGGTAIDFGNSTNDTLNLLPGSRIIGDISLSNNNTINVQTGADIAKLLTFNICGCALGISDPSVLVNITGGAPYVIKGDQIAILDPTAIGMSDRTLMDFAGYLSSLIAGRLNEAGAGNAGGGATAFAPRGGIADMANEAFAAIPALAYAGEGRVPNAASYDRASGISVWSKAFAGARRQEADGPMLGASTVAYGGALGVERQFGSQTRLGAFLGAGQGRLNVDLNSQTVKTNYIFGGVYGRTDWSSSFFDYGVTAGNGSNSSARLIANNAVATGLETANASYNGWFVSPELGYGVRMPMAGGFILTPALRLKYLAGFFDGYTESGSAQTLSVSSRTVQNLEQRAELSVSRIDPLGSGVVKTTVTGGVLGIERLGGTTVNTVLIGQNLSFSAPGRSVVGGVFTGLGFDYQMTDRVGVFAAAEGTVMTDNSVAGSVRGGARYAF